MPVSDEHTRLDVAAGSPALRDLSRRGALLLGLVLVVAAKPPVSQPRKVPSVLFVCQSGTAKSAVARELFRRRARQRGIAVTVFSRGIEIADHVSRPLKRKLAADGIDPARERAQALAPRDWQQADLVVAFNSLPTGSRPARLRDWSNLSSLNDDYAHARPDLDRRIDALLDDIHKGAMRAPDRGHPSRHP